MSIDKLNIRFNEPIYDQENIDKLKNKVNEMIDEVADVEEESIPKTEKLYCHPIIIILDSASYTISASLFIFDKTSTAYDTWDKLTTKMFSISEKISGTARIVFNGCVYNRGTGKTMITSHLDVKKTVNTIQVYGVVDGTRTNFDISSISPDVYDGVNEIYPDIAE